MHNKERNQERIFHKDIKLIRHIFIVLVLVAVFLFLLFPSAIYLTSYFVAYSSLGLIIFWISPKWLCAMTLFYVMYSIEIGGGIFFIWNEHCNFKYSPYLVVLGGLFVLIAGYYVGIKLEKRKSIKITGRIRYSLSISWRDILIASYVLATIAGMLYVYKNSALLFGNLNDGRISAASGNGMILYLFKMHIMIVPLMYEEYKKGKFNRPTFGLFFIFACVQLLFTGFRSPVVTTIIIMIIMNIYQGRLNFRKTIPVISLLLIFAIAFGAWRNQSNLYSIYKIVRAQLFVGAQNLNYVTNTFPMTMPFQHGYTYLINLIMLKPGPDLDFTLWLKEVLGISFSGGGVTPTILGEFYMNFGNMGIFIGMFIYGFFIAKIDKWITQGNITFWKAYVLFMIASSCSGGIANIYISPLVYGLYYSVVLKPMEPGGRIEKSRNMEIYILS